MRGTLAELTGLLKEHSRTIEDLTQQYEGLTSSNKNLNRVIAKLRLDIEKNNMSLCCKVEKYRRVYLSSSAARNLAYHMKLEHRTFKQNLNENQQ
jgi:uncharacterized protein YoxC